jgi:hypothetical protein
VAGGAILEEENVALFVLGGRPRSHQERLWRDVSRRQGYRAAIKAVLIFKLMKFLMYLFVAGVIVAIVAAFIIFGN